MKILRVTIYFLLFTTMTFGQQKSTTAPKSIKANINKTQNSEKKWDGTIKNLFEGNYEDIVVSNNGGVKKIIETINKQGKSKATKENYDSKEYLKVVTPKEEKFVTDFYPIQNLDNFTVIRSKGMACFGECSPGCAITENNCVCNSMSKKVNKSLPLKCKYYKITPLSIHLDSSSLSNIEIILEEGSTISNESVKNINDLVLTEFENATKINSVYKKDGELQYIETQFEDKGKVLVMLSKVVSENNSLSIRYLKYVLGCSGSCDGTTFDCSLNNFSSVGVHSYCNCNTSNCSLKIVPFRNHYYF